MDSQLSQGPSPDLVTASFVRAYKNLSVVNDIEHRAHYSVARRYVARTTVYLTSERSSLVRYSSSHTYINKIKFISSS